jgi:putative oxidoreductase
MELFRQIDSALAGLISNPTVANALDWISRGLVGVIFVLAGYHKLGAGYDGTAAFMASKGVPGGLLPLVILLELGGGLALMAGFQTRLVSLMLAVFCLAAAVLFHADSGDKMQQIMFMKNLAIAGGLLAFARFAAPARSS